MRRKVKTNGLVTGSGILTYDFAYGVVEEESAPRTVLDGNNTNIGGVTLTKEQMEEIVKGHLVGYDNVEEYRSKKLNEISEFAQDKAIYVIQFIHDDSLIEFGSHAQREACKYCAISEGMQQSIWENGGLESFRRGISLKRKVILSAVRECIKRGKKTISMVK